MGIRQKLGLFKTPKRTVKSGSVGFLKRWYKAGKLSAGDVQNAAENILEDGTCETPDLKRLGKAGRVRNKELKQTNKNTSRDGMRCMTADTSYPEVYATSITLWDSDMDKQIEEECYYLLPYEVIDWKLGAIGDVSTYRSLLANSPSDMQRPHG